MASRTPKATPRRAAKRTRVSPGNKKVIVWAGYQKKGMVFLKTKPHCTRQFNPANSSPNGIGEKKPERVPPLRKICASVTL